MSDTTTRSLRDIAQEIRGNWTKVSYAAEPYLNAMATLDKVTDSYLYDSGKSIVLYFLSNASGWRGEVAKRVKAELRGLVS